MAQKKYGDYSKAKGASADESKKKQYASLSELESRMEQNSKSKEVSLGELERRMDYVANDPLYKLAEEVSMFGGDVERRYNSYRDNLAEGIADARKAGALSFRADKLRGQYGDEAVDNLIQYMQDVLDYGKSSREYYGQFGSLERYNEYLQAEKDRNAMYDYDVAAGKKEADELKAVLDQFRKAQHNIALADTAPTYAPGGQLLRDNKAHFESELAKLQQQYGSYEDLLSQWTELNAYINQAERMQTGARLRDTAVNAEDFATGKEYAGGDTNHFGVSYRDVIYHAVNHQPVNYSVGMLTKDEADRINAVRKLTKEEQSIYNYYYNTQGFDAAEQYLDSIMESLNARYGEDIRQSMPDSDLLRIAYGIPAGLDQFHSGMQSLGNAILGRDSYRPTSSTQFAAQGIREDLAGGVQLPEFLGGDSLGQVAYDAVSTTANMAPSILTSYAIGMINPALGTKVGRLMMGASAAGSAYQEKINLGYSPEQAKKYGVMVGASEVLLEKLLGGISKLGGGMLTNTAIKGLDKIDNVLARVAKSTGGKILMNAGSEALEEGLQSIIEPYMWKAVSGEEVTVDMEEALYSALLGFITGGMFEGVDAGTQAITRNVQNRNAGKTIQGVEGGTDRLMELAKEMAASEQVAKQTAKAEAKPSAKNIGKLYRSIAEADGGKSQSVRDFESGIASGSFKTAAESSREAPDGTMDTTESKVTTSEEVTPQAAPAVSAEAAPITEVSVENGKLTLKTADGDMDTSNAVYSSQEEALVYDAVEQVSDIIDTTTANKLSKHLLKLGEVNSDVYTRAIAQAYTYGYSGYSRTAAANASLAYGLTEKQRNVAYGYGEQYRKAKAAADQAKVQAKGKPKTQTKGKVHFEGEAVTKRQRTSMKALEKVAEIMGVQIYVFESKVKGGKRVGENGSYDPNTGSIKIDLYAGQNGEGTMLFTAAHELTHMIQQWSPEKYRILSDFLLEQYGEKGVDVDALVKAQQEKAKSNGVSLTYEQAHAEVIADSMETMLADGKVLEKLVQLKQKDETLFGKIKKFISDLAAKIRNVYKGLTPDSAEGRYVADMKDAVEKLQELFAEALADASENYQQIEKNTTQEGGVKYQARPSAKNPNLLDPRTITRSDVQELLKNVEAGVYDGNTYIPVRISTPGIIQERLFAEDLPMAMPVKKVIQAFKPDPGRMKGKNVRGHGLTADGLLHIIENLDSPDYLFSQKNGRGVAVLRLSSSEDNTAVIVEFGDHVNAPYMNGYEGGEYNISITAFDIDDGDAGLFMMQMDKGWTKVFDKQKEGDPAKKFQATRPFAIEQDSLNENVAHDTTKVKQFSLRDSALKHFGRTYSWKETGYLLTDGSKLDFSGRHEGASGGYRTVDHRDILDIYPEATELDGNGAMVDFMKQGNIRIMPEGDGINLQVRPTKAQERALDDFISRARGEVTLDIDDDKGNTIVSVEYPKFTRAAKVLQDIRNYFETGAEPVISQVAQFHYSDRDTESVSNRSLLANAFESIAKDEMELKKLQEYQRNISEMDAQQRKLTELNAQIKELSFSKGKRDTVKIRALRDEAIKTTNRIQIYDSKLLRLEAAKPLQDVLSRERKRIAEKAKAKTTEAVKAERQKAEVRQSEILRDFRETKAALQGAKSDTAIMEKEFLRIAKEYEKLVAKTAVKAGKDAEAIGSLKDALLEETKKHREDQKLWETEFNRLMREYDSAGRSIAKLEQKIEQQKAMAARKAEDRKKSAVRQKIKAFKEKLEGSLLNPSDRRYVPAGLVNAMVEVCNLIDTDTDLYKKDGSVNKAQERRDQTRLKLLELKSEYDQLKPTYDGYGGEFDEIISNYLEKLAGEFKSRSISEMTLDELNDMYEILRSIDETLRDARKLIGWGDALGVYEAGEAIIAEQAEISKALKNGKRNAAQKARDAMLNYSLSPVRNVERMSGYLQDSALLKLFKKLEQGVRKKNKFVMDAYKSFEDLTSGKEYDHAMYKEFGKQYTDVKGRTFRVSKMQMMQAVLSWEREQANGLRHIQQSGFTFADLKTLQKGKLSDAVSDENAHRVPAANAMAEEFREALRNDPWAQKYMAQARKFFNETAKNAINETMMTLKHRIVAKDKAYIPYEVDKNFVTMEISAEQNIQQTINSYGMLKELQKGAPQPLIITGLNNVIDRHIDMVGNVYGLAVEIRNFNKVWNMRPDENPKAAPTVKAAIDGNWGKGGVKSIEQAIKDVQGPRVREKSALYNRVKSGYIGATFALNMSVVTKQIGSLYSATSMLRWRDPTYMIGNLIYTMANSKKIASEVDKYTASAWMRRQGLSDAELHTLITEAKKPGLLKFFSKFPTIINPAKWITAMDSAVALSLWRFAKKDVQKRTGLKGEELLKATAEFYDEVIENTQSMTDVLHRPEVQKKGDIVSESLGMFKTDLYQMAGQLEVAKGRLMANRNKANANAIGKTLLSIACSAAWGQLMTSLFALIRYKVNQYRDEEDKDLTWESWLKRQGFAFGGDILGYFLPIFGSETVTAIENMVYGESEELLDSVALTAANDLYDAMITVGNSVVEGEMPKWDQWLKILTKTLQVVGFPANNILRTGEAIRLHAIDIANGEFLSFEAGVDRSPKNHIHRIVEAVDSGKINVAVALFEDALDETAMEKADGGSYGEEEIKDAKSTLKTALGNKYKDREITRELAIDTLVKCFELSQEDAEKQIKEWDFKVEYGYAWTDRRKAYFSGAISAKDLKNALMDIGGKTEEEADEYIAELRYEADYPELVDLISYAQYERWQTAAEPHGVSLDLFADVAVYRDDGSAGSVKSQDEVMAYIESVTSDNKMRHALWCCFYKASTSPWN